MAFHVPRAPGIQQMLKEGTKNFQGLEEAVFRNIKACNELSATLSTTFGPYGMSKMVINHIEKLYVTNDAATILKELEVIHPAAKMLVLATEMCEQECGDGTNFVLIFAGALLKHAEELLRNGLKETDIIDGYEQACKKAIEILPGLVCSRVEELRNVDEVAAALKTSIGSKQYGHEDFLSSLIAKACVNILPAESLRFNVDNIRVSKIPGSDVLSSSIVNGMLFQRSCESNVQNVKNASIAVFTCPFDMLATETKGTVLLKNAKELKDFSKGEENLMEAHVKAIADSGVNVVVSGGKVSDLALHFANKYNLMVVRLTSKWDVRRLCRTVGATALPKVTVPTQEETGHCSVVRQDEVGNRSVVVFEHTDKGGKVCTVALRAATDNVLDDLERAVDDGVNNYKVYTKDARLLAGAGACEIELSKRIKEFGEQCPGLEQYAIEKFAKSLECVPRCLAENAGLNPTDVVTTLNALHQDEDKQYWGVDVETGKAINAKQCGILDSYLVKYWALRLATNAACTILQVDQIIVAKRAGGPKPPKQNGDWDDTDN